MAKTNRSELLNGKSPFGFVSYRTLNREQRFRSTKETDLVKTEAIASAIEDGLGKAKVGEFTEKPARSNRIIGVRLVVT